MALHNTQCPHCFTTYVISDEQLRVSEGMVRCGSCRERFEARLVNLNAEAPRFDPRETFIEPLTEERNAERERAEQQAIRDQARMEEKARQAKIEQERLYSASKLKTENIDLDFDSRVLSVDKLLENIKAKEKRDAEEAAQRAAFEAAAENIDFEKLAREKAEKAEKEELEKKVKLVGYNSNNSEQAELDLPSSDTSGTQSKTFADSKTFENTTPLSEEKPITEEQTSAYQEQESLDDVENQREESKLHTGSAKQRVSKESLIEQVDSLVDDKLSSAKQASALSDQVQDKHIVEPFELDRKVKHKRSFGARLGSWLLAIALLLLALLLLIAMVYQLWLRQVIVLDEQSSIQQSAKKQISQFATPIIEELYNYDVVLPSRRNLSQLELASARTEAHPSRPSTTLLRISIINHASIEQPLPWLEMSLSDAEGKLVSRRSLSPRDYVYQNATNNLIGARELKKVTIELLSFPKQATGYELKILNK